MNVFTSASQYSFYDCRDKFEATPKDRLSDEYQNYQEITDLLDESSLPPENIDPLFQEHTITVSVCFFTLMCFFQCLIETYSLVCFITSVNLNFTLMTSLRFQLWMLLLGVMHSKCMFCTSRKGIQQGEVGGCHPYTLVSSWWVSLHKLVRKCSPHLLFGHGRQFIVSKGSHWLKTRNDERAYRMVESTLGEV